MSSVVPVGPFVTAHDVKHGEFFLDANGLAWRADRTRVAELDGPPINVRTIDAPATLDRGEVLRVLVKRADRNAMYCAIDLGFTLAEWSAAIASAEVKP